LGGTAAEDAVVKFTPVLTLELHRPEERRG
jgi:hypothetical protein